MESVQSREVLKKKKRIIRAVLFLAMAIILRGCSRSYVLTPEDYFGEWYLKSSRSYRGGLISEVQAINKIGKVVNIGQNSFTMDGKAIDNPKYQMRVVKNNLEEGVVPKGRTTAIYGFMPDRKKVVELLVFEKPNDELPFTVFEILNRRNMIEVDDNYIYFLNRK